MKKYFRRKKIIYTKKWMPGELVRTFLYRGEKYVRIAFTNKIRYAGAIPMTDVKMSDVIGVRELPSVMHKGVCNIFGLKARSRYYKIERNNG